LDFPYERCNIHLGQLITNCTFTTIPVMRKYAFFDHTADIGCEIFGHTRKELFANAVTALFDLIIDHQADENQFPAIKKIKPREKKLILEGSDLEDLLINFLREILYLFNGKGLLTINCRIIELTSRSIVAQLQVEHYNTKKHFVTTEIKAVTYHGFRIQRTAKGWKARVIFDV
jgi:SHS2 domain-containing protein